MLLVIQFNILIFNEIDMFKSYREFLGFIIVLLAFNALQRKLDVYQDKATTILGISADDTEMPNISLQQRALPLIHLLQAAIKHQCYVMWY